MSQELPAIAGYTVEAEVGRGGMGIVYRAIQHRTGATVALKMLLGSRDASYAELARFRVEITAMSCLHHSNIVRIRDVGLHGSYPYVAMEFAEQGTLKQAIANGPLVPRRAAELVRSIASAMQHAHHRGMLHRDLKPANVLLMGDGSIKVSDFGLVKFTNPFRDVRDRYSTTLQHRDLLEELLHSKANELRAQYDPNIQVGEGASPDVTRSIWGKCAIRTGVLADAANLDVVQEFMSIASQAASVPSLPMDELTRAGTVMGSPNYMASEQAMANHDQLGPSTDVYAMGGILYELLTGRPPFRSASFMELMQQAISASPVQARSIVPEISMDIEAICLKCLEKSQDKRYQSAQELADDLSRFLDGYTPLAIPREEPKIKKEAVDHPPLLSTISKEPPAPSTRSWWPFRRS
jgi:eukaryotic-like serine/threonine-protein kinase